MAVERRLAVLSNVNMNLVIRMLQKEASVYQAEGYGNELGILMNPASSYHAFAPEITFLILDLMELLEHELEPEAARERVEGWFRTFESALREEETYYVSDAYLFGAELEAAFEPGIKQCLEQLWQKRLEQCRSVHGNVRIFPYRRLIERMGEQISFSVKMWYMGKIRLSNEAQKQLCGLMLEKVRLESRTAKKVLLLDLDNTLWGGLAGETEHTPVELSEDHIGLAYKNLQRVIAQMQRQGVVLAVVSKNNEADALEIIKNHPHMVLRESAFAARRINWQPKHENIKEIAAELNLGLDAMVFWDDSPGERQLVKELLPQVTVPDFPEKPEELAPAMAEIYREYFEKPVVTAEDLEKTAQYAANSARRQLEESTGSFEDYLKQLKIVLRRVEPGRHAERLLQLLNKTNQFNLTTRRHTQGDLAELLQDREKRVYFYGVSDRFGDNGLVAAAVVGLNRGKPAVEEFVLSCRVMGRNIEYAILDEIEEELKLEGYDTLRGIYVPTPKNRPVARLYEQLGYRECGETRDQGKIYEISLADRPGRTYYVEREKEAEESE